MFFTLLSGWQYRLVNQYNLHEYCTEKKWNTWGLSNKQIKRMLHNIKDSKLKKEIKRIIIYRKLGLTGMIVGFLMNTIPH